MIDEVLINDARKALSKILGQELAEIIKAISVDPDKGPNDYFVDLPERYTVDSDVGELMGLVAQTANSYHRIARFCGMAKAEYTIAHGAYKNKLKTHRVGKNDAERDKNGAEAAKAEYEAMIVVETIYEMAEKLETIARIKSESSRKILDKAQAMAIASHREGHGDISAVKSYNPW